MWTRLCILAASLFANQVNPPMEIAGNVFREGPKRIHQTREGSRRSPHKEHKLPDFCTHLEVGGKRPVALFRLLQSRCRFPLPLPDWLAGNPPACRRLTTCAGNAFLKGNPCASAFRGSSERGPQFCPPAPTLVCVCVCVSTCGLPIRSP